MSAEHLTTYFAYGLNVHKEGLQRRCPDAIEIAAGRLDDYRLRFHRVASISSEPGRGVHGALWAISERDLTALDTLEGYPSLYRRERVSIHADERAVPAFTYILNDPGDLEPPWPAYLKSIEAGYREWGLPEDELLGAVGLARAAEVRRNGGSLVEIARAAGARVRTDKVGQTTFNIRPGG